MQNFFYRVGKGESIYSIAEKFDIPALLIINENNLKKEISAGDLIVLTKHSGITYTVELNDTLSSIAKKFHISQNQIENDNGIDYVFYGLKIFLKTT